MKENITYKRIWQIAYPIILGSIAQNIINVTDTAFLGRVGEVALGASAIAGIFYLTLVTLGWGFGIGLQIIVARRNGEENFQQIGRVIDHGLYFLVTIAILVFLLFQSFGEQFFNAVLESDAITEEGLKYINIRIYGIFFAFVNILFRAFYVGLGKTKVLTVTTVIMAIVNVTLDYILIFGHLGFEEYGIKGAAYASLAAEISATIFFIFYTYRYYNPKEYKLFYFRQIDWNVFGRIFKVATPTMLQNFISFFGWFIFFLFVEQMGERPLAISNIIRSLYVLLMIPIMGFASSENTLVSYVIGKGQSEDVLKVTKRVSFMCFVSVLIIVIGGIFIPDKLIALYTDNAELIKASIPSYYVISGSVLFIGLGFVMFNGVSGTGKTNISLLLEVIIIVIYLGTTYLISQVENVQIHQVWMVEYLYAVLLTVLSYVYLKYGNWKGSEV